MIIGITSHALVNEYAAAVIAQLARAGHRPAFVVCCRRPPGSGWARRLKDAILNTGVGSRLWHYRRTVARADASRYLREHAESLQLRGWDWPLPRVCEAHGMELVRVRDLNDPKIADYVRDRQADLLINAGGGIFREALIRTPRIGILNAHMGLLPALRGMNVLEWSLFLGRPAGVTLHLIDRGVDTGDILRSRKIRVEAGDTIASLRARALAVSVDLIALGVEGLANAQLPRIVQSRGDGRQYFAMHPRLKQIVENRLHSLKEDIDGPTRTPGAGQ